MEATRELDRAQVHTDKPYDEAIEVEASDENVPAIQRRFQISGAA